MRRWTPACAGVTKTAEVTRSCSQFTDLCEPKRTHKIGPLKHPCVYTLASKRNGTLYVGVTSDLVQRIWQHKHDLVDGFTKRYAVHRLVWYEACDDMGVAIAREKAIKEWRRAWKVRLIQETNPEWNDLYGELL